MLGFSTFVAMDSLTQIVLGAACGEVALGKKIGNKAQLFGAIGGTIPDLDVIIGNLLFGNEIDAMAFHRGIMHSLLFACLASLVIGFLFFELYNTGKRKDTTTLRDWMLLFLLAIGTHPLLDSFTPYGTQLFLPFSNYRVAFNNISVADPFYTVPFLICLLVSLFYKRTHRRRRRWVLAGIYVSSLYLLCTIGNKFYIDYTFDQSFKKAQIKVDRFSAQPTIFNNALWYAVAERKKDYVVSFYSVFDRSFVAKKFTYIPKRHNLIDINHPDIRTLRWFSKEYFSIQQIDSTGQLLYKDLRYPLLNEDDANSSLFSFQLVQDGSRWDTKPIFGRSINEEDFKKFLRRILGN